MLSPFATFLQIQARRGSLQPRHVATNSRRNTAEPHFGKSGGNRFDARRVFGTCYFGFSVECVALIDADRLDYYHQLEHERIHLLLIDDARRGLEDIAAGRTHDANDAIAKLQRRRKAAAKRGG